MMKISQLIAILVILGLMVAGAVYTFKERRQQAQPPTTTNETDSWNSYSDPASGFSIKYPPGFSVNEAYSYTELGPGKEIPGLSFTIPASMATGTNLSDDTRLSVETLPTGAKCIPASFLDSAQSTSTVTDAGVTYQVAQGGGAAAGNRYEEIVYILPSASKSSPCTAIRYFIHSGAIGNYDPGAVKEFDRAALVSLFDKIRRTYQGLK